MLPICRFYLFKRLRLNSLRVGVFAASLFACLGLLFGLLYFEKPSADFQIDRNTCCDAGPHCPCTEKAMSCHGGCGNGAGGIVGAFNGRAYGCCLPDP